MRRALTIITISFLGLGAVFASMPFIKSMQPSERVFSNLLRIDLSGIKPGQYKLLQKHVLPKGWAADEWGVLIIRKYDGEYDIWDIPYIDGKVGMPDNHWWRIYEYCENFGPTLQNGKILESGPIKCHDDEMSKWAMQEWRWSISGENLGKMTVDLNKTKGSIEGNEFVFFKDS